MKPKINTKIAEINPSLIPVFFSKIIKNEPGKRKDIADEEVLPMKLNSNIIFLTVKVTRRTPPYNNKVKISFSIDDTFNFDEVNLCFFLLIKRTRFMKCFLAAKNIRGTVRIQDIIKAINPIK